MSTLPQLYLDLSLTRGRPVLLHPDGTEADLEQALAEGFVVSPEDAPAILTLVVRHVGTLSEFNGVKVSEK